ncbi:DUF4491 family protein [Lacrimispora saccharolytica]|uniref:Membrane protein n=1 Tax=Lacrimispora saccharolytica (strain ATCC 35040 / DSM 2544 / NRCC 2533 / WM1) TaxID=610130 RepID=D9R531_LACSW|nr:DUF4491 family protein [Lacrimispora saccharolytica]ADL05138.1 membrane protein [[Clostridium] saccharolyticum WM1]QRV20676.1 DUF4491 family protein [Lacrimispora saccharolytica]
MNYEGIIIGMGTFLIIGLLHPVVIKSEYYFSSRIWPFFLVGGFVCIGLSLASGGRISSALLAVLGFSLLWSIKELEEQKKRVEKGWFPENPKKKGK